MAQAEEALGSLQVLVCNAGIAQQKLFTDTTDEDWHRMMAVDLDGAFYACRAVLPGLIRQKYGRIVLISSMWGQTGGSCDRPGPRPCQRGRPQRRDGEHHRARRH